MSEVYYFNLVSNLKLLVKTLITMLLLSRTAPPILVMFCQWTLQYMFLAPTPAMGHHGSQPNVIVIGGQDGGGGMMMGGKWSLRHGRCCTVDSLLQVEWPWAAGCTRWVVVCTMVMTVVVR